MNKDHENSAKVDYKNLKSIEDVELFAKVHCNISIPQKTLQKMQSDLKSGYTTAWSLGRFIDQKSQKYHTMGFEWRDDLANSNDKKFVTCFAKKGELFGSETLFVRKSSEGYQAYKLDENFKERIVCADANIDKMRERVELYTVATFLNTRIVQRDVEPKSINNVVTPNEPVHNKPASEKKPVLAMEM